MWVKIDDGFFDHPKARAVGRDGRSLFIAGLCWSAQNLTDGFIPLTVVDLIARKAEVNARQSVSKLVHANLWEKSHDGFVTHDYHDYNPPAAGAREIRQQRAIAGRRGGLKSRPPGSKTEANEKQTPKQNGSKPEAKRNPVPVPVYIREQQQVSEAQQQLMDRNHERLVAEAAAWKPPTEEERARALKAAHEAKTKIRADRGQSDLEEEPW